MTERLFPIHLPSLEWLQFPADGFTSSVCGLIHRAGESLCGLPLGGIGTGCMDLNTDGTLGRASIFNSFVPPREINKPFLSLSMEGKVWVLSTASMPGAQSALQVHYWGHYPVADLEYETDSPVQVGLRAWSPFLPGCSESPNTPGAVFQVQLRNSTSRSQSGSLAFAFPGMSEAEAQCDQFDRKPLLGRVAGVQVTCGKGQGFALGFIAGEGLSHTMSGSGGSIGSALTTPASSESPEDPGATLSVNFHLEPGETRQITFLLGWYHPRWIGTEWRHYLHKYSERFSSPAEVVEFLAQEHSAILTRILAWQQVIYSNEDLPVWLRDQLVNILHTITEDSFWASNSIPREDWCGRTGIFGLTESPRSTPHVAMPSDWYGALPLVFFFPDLARASLRCYAHFQLPNGEIPLGVGWGTDLGAPIYHFLHTQNNAVYVDLADRLWQRDQDDSVLTEFYPVIKKAIEYLLTLDRDGDGLLDLEPEPTGNQFYGAWPWHGTSPYVAGFWLAALSMARRMAEAMNDPAFSHTCQLFIEQGSRALDEKLWNGEYYLLYNDTHNGLQSDTILSGQLAGQWIAFLHGLDPVFPPRHVEKVLDVIKRMTIPATRFGMLNAVRPDGSIDQTGGTHSEHIFPGENLAVAMTALYCGDQRTGEEISRRVMENIVIRQHAAWDMPNMVEPVEGKITHGTDFYQMMIQWGLPLALRRQDIAAACQSGGMIERILHAAKS